MSFCVCCGAGEMGKGLHAYDTVGGTVGRKGWRNRPLWAGRLLQWTCVISLCPRSMLDEEFGAHRGQALCPKSRSRWGLGHISRQAPLA